MRAFLIDPVAQTVTQIEYSGDFKGPDGAYEKMQCDLIEVVYLNPDYTTDELFVDEEGLLKGGELHMFTTSADRYLRPLAGRAIVTGAPDEEGNGTPATMDYDAVVASITWHGRVR